MNDRDRSRLHFEVDEQTGSVWATVPEGETTIYLLCQLGTGVGSSGLSLDRGMQGKVRVARFERDGQRCQLVQLNKKFRVRSADPDQRKVGEESFLRSVVFAGRVGSDGRTDVSDFVISDHVGVAAHMAEQGQGAFAIDGNSSRVVESHTSVRGGGYEITVQTTFSGTAAGSKLVEVSPAETTFTVIQRLSVIDAPIGFRPRVFHPRSGGYGKGFADHGVRAGQSPQIRYQPRFRLDPVESADGPIAVRRPIEFWVDPGIDEPWRSEVVAGGSWWADAFRAAGYDDAFRVAVRPGDVDPLDADVTNLWWVHRSGRGWSRAAASTDPMTGEILRANVRLGSQRVHQVMQIAEVVLAPYGKPDEAQLLDQATEFVKARVRRLAAHEIGHAIGFMHNYASTNHPVASVMDYPHPRIRMRADGQGVDISDPYPEGLGDWDYFTVRHAYAQFDPADETAQLSRLRQQAAAAGLTYVTDADGAATTASNPDGVQWVMGGDAFEGLRDILRVRRHVLEHFGPGVLAPDRDAGELGERLTTAYLLHRHELTGVARYLGGVRYESGWAGDTGIGTSAVAGPTQYQALAALADLLSADHLRVPRRAVQCVNPVGARYATIPEYLTSEFGPVFDPLRAAEVAASLVIASAVEPARLNRLAWQHAQDPSIPSVAEVASQTIVAAFSRPNDESDALLAATAGATVLDQVLATLLRSELHSVVAGDLTEALHSIAESWADESFGARVRASARIRAFLDDPARVNLRQAPPIPPGAPI